MKGDISVQIENKSLSIETTHQTLHPVVFISWFLDIVARPRKCPKAVMIILHIIHFGVCSVIVAYDAIDFFTFDNVTYNKVFEIDKYKIIYYMNIVLCYVSAYYYGYHGIRQYNKWPELMSKMKNLDQKIEREMFVDHCEQPIKSVEVLAILATFACGPLSLIIHAVYYYFTHPQVIFASGLLLYYAIAQSLINSFIFDIIVYVLYHRFQRINELIVQLDKPISAPWIMRKIRCIRELHTEICDLIIMVNDIFGFHLLLCSANCFTMVGATLFIIDIDFVERNYTYMLINAVFWISYTAQFGLMCWICTLARQESDKTGKIIYKIVLNYKAMNVDKLNGTRNQPSLEIPPENQDGEQNSNKSSSYNLNYTENLDRDCVRNEVNDFSIQLQQHLVAITACNLFEMNNALLSGIVGAIFTHFITLVELGLSEHLDNNRNSRRC